MSQMSITDWVTIISSIVAILGVVVGLTTYLTRMSSSLAEQHLKQENQRLTEKVASQEVINKDLANKLATIQKTGSASFIQKSAIDAEVSIAKNLLSVAACSILVPYPLSNTPEFVFLSIDSEASERLRRTRIPLNKGIVGYVFKNGKPYSSADTQDDLKFFDKADSRSGFKTENILCLPITFDNQTIGVIQFLNKVGGSDFDKNDLDIAGRILSSITPKITEFCKEPDNFEILGLGSDTEAKDATVMVCDISNSSTLSSSLPLSVVEDIFNEYLEHLSEIGFKYGATIDKFMGDGFILHFNISRSIKNHRIIALQAANEMKKEFVSLRSSWVRYGFPASNIYNRITIESGPVHEIMLGHPQYRQLTLIGDCLIIASYLSSASPRNKDIIIVGENTYHEIKSHSQGLPIPRENLGKAISMINSAYEIQAITSSI